MLATGYRLERRISGQAACGGILSHCLGYKIEQQKKNKNEIPMASCDHYDQFTRNNQPKIGVWDAGEYEGEVQQAGDAEEAQYHCFGGVES